jgi:hypothetical protein
MLLTDSQSRILLRFGPDGEAYVKNYDLSANVQEVQTARGSAASLNSRLSTFLDVYGAPKTHTFGAHYLRETRQRLRNLSLSATTQLIIAVYGDSWSHGVTRYTGPLASLLKTTYGDAGPGWCGFAWGFGGASNLWAGGNGSASSELAVTLTTGWAVHYGTSVSPDSCDVYSASTSATITVNFTGSGNISAVKLCHIAGGGVLQYRFNSGTWTQINTATGTGAVFTNLSGVPVGTWSLDINVVSGTVTVAGIDVQKSTSGVRLHKVAATGSTAQGWGALNSTQWRSSIGNLNTNLSIILLGTNDQGASRTPAQFAADLQTQINNIKATYPLGDILLVMPCENQRVSNTYPMSAYTLAAYQVAISSKCAFMDLQYLFGDTPSEYSSSSARPWFNADGIHPEPGSGGVVILDAIYRLLTSTH